jgi:hypothetical protein
MAQTTTTKTMSKMVMDAFLPRGEEISDDDDGTDDKADDEAGVGSIDADHDDSTGKDVDDADVGVRDDDDGDDGGDV